MKIPSIMTNESLESLYDGLDTEEVNLPRTFKKLRLGLLPRISQFFITLLKHHSDTSIKFFQLDVHDNEGINDLLADPQSLTAILMAENVFGKSIEKERMELKSRLNKSLQERLDKSIYKEGHRLQLFAVDHSARKYAYPSCFYLPEGTMSLKQSEFYSKLLERFINSCAKGSNLTTEEKDSLGELLFELVENTDQHGKSDFTSAHSERSVRGLIVDYKLITGNQQSQTIGGENTVITEYLEGIRDKNRTVHLLEISIFDSGTGIAESLKNSVPLDISNINYEAQVISKSFAKGITSKSNPIGYGRGLHNVRKVLSDRKGFVSIRTGRVSLYRDFNKNDLNEKDVEQLSLFDEVNRTASKNYTELKAVEGLAYSILVPIK